MNIYTIGFTKKSAEKFFDLLQTSGTTTLIDVRLNNVSQLAGFAKRDDLKFFLDKLCGMAYIHRPDLAPTQPMLDDYKKRVIDWATYKKRFLEIIKNRSIKDAGLRGLVDNAVLLCTEDKPHQCHRRLVAEHLAERWGGVTIEHLV